MTNHSNSPLCPDCGEPLPPDSPQALCPACLIHQALASRTMAPVGDSTPPLPPPTPEEMSGKFPGYEIVECLGRGGMGVVYKAWQKSLDRWVAIKVLAPERVHDERFAEHFEREAKTLARMSHPNIVTVFDHGETDGLFYIMMEYVDGVNLRDLLREGKMEPKQALAIIPPICQALEYAHDKGVIHRDIKPENILLDREGRVKIADFGIAKLIQPVASVCDRRTSTVEEPQGPATVTFQAGTPDYAAPEQADGKADHRADIYALGAVLYEMLTGERPNKDVVAPSRKVQIDVRLDEIVLRALEKTPELRYQTAGEFRTVVETIAAIPGGGGPPPTQVSRNPASQSRIGSVPANPAARVSPYASPVAFLLAYGGFIFLLATTAGQLPPQVASHFGAEGHPNGWMSRSFYLAFVAAMPLLFGGMAMLISWMTHRLPTRFLNIPRRDFWLTPERRPETAAFLRRRMFWLAVMMTIFFGGLHLLTVQANQTTPARLSLGGLLALIIVFLLAMMIWTVSLLMRLAEVEQPLVEPSSTHGQKSPSGEARVEQAELDALSGDRGNWHALLFYYCPEDPRIVVPKRVNGFGWTLNFANPWSIPFLLALIAGIFGTNSLLDQAGLSIREYQIPYFLVVLGCIVWICHRMSRGPVPRVGNPPPIVRSLVTAVIAMGVGLAAVSWPNAFRGPDNRSRESGKSRENSPDNPRVALPSDRTMPAEFNWKEVAEAALGKENWEKGGTDQALLHVANFHQPSISARRYAIIGEIKYENVEGNGYLEMWSHFSPSGKYFTRALDPPGSGPMAAITGSSDWRPFTLPFDRSGTTDPLSKLEVNLHLPAKGVVYLRGLRLVEDPAAPAPLPTSPAPLKPIPPEAANEVVPTETTTPKPATISVEVTGLVARPGKHSLRGPATLLDALAAAGGWTGDGNLHARIAETDENHFIEVTHHNLRDILAGQAVNPYVPNRAHIIVSEAKP